MAQLLSGWGRAGFGELAFGEETIPVTLTAPAAGTTGAPVAGVNAQAIASIQGAVGTVGSLSVAVDGEAIVTLTGSGTVGTSAIGTATTVSNNNLSVTLNAATGSAGAITTDAKASVFPTGVSAAAETGVILVWGEVNDSQTRNWGTVTTSQTPGWEEVA